MGAFDDMVAADSAVFTDANASAEVETTSWKRNGATLQASIAAQVFRDEMMFENDVPVLGTKLFISSVNVVGGWTPRFGDVVSIAKLRGGTAETRTVANILSSDAGGWMVKIT